MTPDHGRDFACLVVRRWARYRKAWHNLSPEQRQCETKRLSRLKARWAEEGRMPWPEEFDRASDDHTLRSHLSALACGIPTDQEAYLTVETVAKTFRFTSLSYLAGHASKPWSWWKGGQAGEVRSECLGFLVLIARWSSKDEPTDG